MSCRVLVVEDEIFVAIEIESVVQDLGYLPVGIAQDSQSALALSREAELAFVDLNLIDGPTGIEVGRRLADSGVTVLFMTANPAQLGDGVPGTIGVLPKPVNDIELKQAVQFAVAMRNRDPSAVPPRRLRLFPQVSAAVN
jgi:CheY-like chemotaxis protein